MCCAARRANRLLRHARRSGLATRSSGQAPQKPVQVLLSAQIRKTPANAQSRPSGFPSAILTYVNCKAGGGRGVGRTASPSSSALCSTPGPAGLLGASLWRDALCPDISTAARRAAEGKGGAAWRRDRSRAQPRTGPASGRAWRARRGPTPCPQRAPWHPHRQEWQKLSTAEKFKFFLSSDSGPHKPLIFMMKIGSNQRKRAGRSEETGG